LFKPGRNAVTQNDARLAHEPRSYVLAGRRLKLPPLRSLGIAAGVVLAVALLGTAAWFWNVSQQQRGSSAYADALIRHRAADSPQATPEARNAAIADLERVLGEYPSNAMAPQASYVLGNLRFAAGQYDRARAAYGITASRAGAGTLATLARASIGYAWEAERKFPEAVRAFETAVADLKPTSFYYEEALVDLARAQERAGQKDAAITSYRRLLKDRPGTPRVPEIRARLASLGATP
jgi:tetratricopeptide (TPR) repeat protein